MPGLLQYLGWTAVVARFIKRAQVSDHLIDQSHGFLTCVCGLTITQYAVMRPRARVEERGACRRWERIASRLVHHARYVAEESRLRDIFANHTMELGVAKEGHFPGGGDTQPITIEQSDHVTHTGYPRARTLVDDIAACHEDIFAPLQRGK